MSPIFCRAALFLFLAAPFRFSALGLPALGFRGARAETALCENGECMPVISATTYQNRPAFKLTDGKTEAVIVPQIGRIMRFGRVGGPNLLWNSADSAAKKGVWKNYGGDKTWLAPQSSWPAFHGQGWPPDTAFDGSAHTAEVLTGGKLKMTTPRSLSGMRLTRTMYFDANGEFVIEQTATKESGETIRASIWSITQIVPGEAVYLPTDINSTYPNGYYAFPGFNSEAHSVTRVANSTLLKIWPSNAGGNSNSGKFGVDAPISALISVHDQTAFLQRSAKPTGIYPDAAGGAGFPVEVFINGDPKNRYVELEILGPLKTFAIGGKSTHTVRWSLHTLSARYPVEFDREVEKLLHTQ